MTQKTIKCAKCKDSFIPTDLIQKSYSTCKSCLKEMEETEAEESQLRSRIINIPEKNKLKGKCCKCRKRIFGMINRKNYCAKHYTEEKASIKSKRNGVVKPLCGVITQRGKTCKNKIWYNKLCRFHYMMKIRKKKYES